MLFSCNNLKVWFPVYGGKLFQKKTGYIRAVDGVHMEIARGMTFALAGESGCGKTTLARTILGLEYPTSGTLFYDEAPLSYEGNAGKILRKKIQAVFQDPYGSLNPRRSIKDTVAEGLEIHSLCASQKEKEERVAELLEQVGLNPGLMHRFPQEFSAGQRQRIAIARSISVNPEFLILDEPVSALDVSIQGRILELLKNLQDTLGLTYLFISHDLAVVKKVADYVAVMYLGKIVEEGTPRQIYKDPLHPYTKALLAAVPIPDPRRARARAPLEISDEVPSAEHVPSGCRFHTRCPIRKFPLCQETEPVLEKKHPNRFVACHLVQKITKNGI